MAPAKLENGSPKVPRQSVRARHTEEKVRPARAHFIPFLLRRDHEIMQLYRVNHEITYPFSYAKTFLSSRPAGP
jgi:hypothetical protein